MPPLPTTHCTQSVGAECRLRPVPCSFPKRVRHFVLGRLSGLILQVVGPRIASGGGTHPCHRSRQLIALRVLGRSPDHDRLLAACHWPQWQASAKSPQTATLCRRLSGVVVVVCRRPQPTVRRRLSSSVVVCRRRMRQSEASGPCVATGTDDALDAALDQCTHSVYSPVPRGGFVLLITLSRG